MSTTFRSISARTSLDSHDERAADFLDLACLHYGVAPGSNACTGYPEGPHRRKQAARILERHPNLGRATLHTAVVCGDVAEVHRILAATPSSACTKGGREGWEPLLYLCYGRLPIATAADNAVAIAQALLDHGADPNCHWTYQWQNQTMRWSALCGVIGDGESGPITCPPHPAAEPLAALLLSRGADPNQSQALYNTMLRGDDDRWLRVLVAHGLNANHTINWSPGDANNLFAYLLEHAVQMNQLQRAAFLLAHGANPHSATGRSLHERALLEGSIEMAELLLRHGAPHSQLSGRDAFRAACMRLDRAAAEGLLLAHPEYIEDCGAMLVNQAAKHDRKDLAAFLLALGVSPNVDYGGPSARYRALHQAACLNHVDVAQFLIDHGADVDARDEAHRATPLAWAIRAQMTGTIELFARHTHDVFTLAAGGLTTRLAALLAEDASRANHRLAERIGLGWFSAEPEETPLFALPQDEEKAFEVAEVLLAAGADPTPWNRARQTAGEKAAARGLGDVAGLLLQRLAEK